MFNLLREIAEEGTWDFDFRGPSLGGVSKYNFTQVLSHTKEARLLLQLTNIRGNGMGERSEWKKLEERRKEGNEKKNEMCKQ